MGCGKQEPQLWSAQHFPSGWRGLGSRKVSFPAVLEAVFGTPDRQRMFQTRVPSWTAPSQTR